LFLALALTLTPPQVDCFVLFFLDGKVFHGYFYGIYYHFCFQTYVMPLLQLRCLQRMHFFQWRIISYAIKAATKVFWSTHFFLFLRGRVS